MKKKVFLAGLAAFLLAIGLIIAGCEGTVGAAGKDGIDGEGTEGPAGAPFTAATNDDTVNDADTLGFVGTGVSSSNAAVATAAITEDDKIAITSHRTGDAVITVQYGPFTSTIPVSVGNLGAIELGDITKEEVTRTVPTGGQPYSLTTDSTHGITVVSLEKTGTPGYPGHKVLVTLGGTIPNAGRGKIGNASTALNDSSLYGTNKYAGGGASLYTDFALIDIRAIGDIAPTVNVNTYRYNWATMTCFALPAWYRMAWVAEGKHIMDYKAAGSALIGTITNQTVVPDASFTGKVRYTGTTFSDIYISSSYTNARFTSAGDMSLMLWENDPGKLLTIQFDGNNTGGDYSAPGDLPTKPNGKLVWIDYSAVTWLSE